MTEGILIADKDFDQPLADVAERDIDLLLLEELHSNDEFVTWFCGKLELSDVSFDGAWHSFFNSLGETDLTLRVICKSQRCGILIENKIAAREQENQSERYLIRGENEVSAGRFDDCRTVICAPKKYLDGLKDSKYQFMIAYEDIVGWFSKQPEKRSKWRVYVINQAIAQSKRGYFMVVDQEITAFHKAYWRYLKSNHPGFIMPEPKDKGARSDWINLKVPGFRRGVQLHHIFTGSTMELGFANRTVHDLLATGVDWKAEGIYPTQRGNEACLVINTEKIDLRGGFDEQLGNVELSLEAAGRLTRYANILEPHARRDKFVSDCSDFAILKEVEPLSAAEAKNLQEDNPSSSI